MSYNANDIETLDFRTAIRTKIAMYLGSADNQGVLQAIREIITNSIDEYTMGYGNEIYVDLEIGADGNETLREAHAVAERVHDHIEKEFPKVKHIMVHVNPA